MMKHWHFYFICCSWTTKIVLPLKESIRSQTTTLAARFNDIHPSLLLFLNRLRKITIDNRVESFVQNIHRKDYGENVVEITHDDKMDRWLVVKKTLDASKISLQVGWWPESYLIYIIYFNYSLSITVYSFFLHLWNMTCTTNCFLVPCPTNWIPVLWHKDEVIFFQPFHTSAITLSFFYSFQTEINKI